MLLDQLSDHWTLQHRHCAEHSSHLRLGRLLHRLTHHDLGVQESALAELELATQLIRVGLRVTFCLSCKPEQPIWNVVWDRNASLLR